jgi:hypothetical protein
MSKDLFHSLEWLYMPAAEFVEKILEKPYTANPT